MSHSFPLSLSLKWPKIKKGVLGMVKKIALFLVLVGNSGMLMAEVGEESSNAQAQQTSYTERKTVETNLSESEVSESDGLSLKGISILGNADLIEEAREKSVLGGVSLDKPMAGSVLYREELELIKSVNSLTDLLTRVPGVSKTRNMRIADGGKNYTDNRVNGMRVSRTGVVGFVDETNTADIDRIEFINGPGSVLQSSYAIGGTINVITKTPPETPELRVSQEFGGHDFYRTEVVGGAKLDNGFGFTGNVSVKRDKGWRDRSSDDKDAFSFSLAGQPTERSSFMFRLEYIDDDALYPGTLTEAQWKKDWRQAQPGVYGRGQTTYLTPSLHFKQALGESGEITLGLSQRKESSTTFGNTSTFTTFSNSISESEETDTSFQAIFRQDFELAKSRLYVGFERISGETDNKQYNNAYSNALALLGNFKKGALSTSGYNTTTDTHESPFVNYEFSPLDKLRIHAGLRADHIRFSVDDKTAANKDGRATFKEIVPKIGATYELDPNNLIWTSYAEGFLAPAVNTLLGSGDIGCKTTGCAGGKRGYVPAANLNPEAMKTYELGFRGYLNNAKLRYDVTLYKTNIIDMVLQRDCTAAEKLGPNGCYRMNENVGEVSAKGIETGLSYAATSWLDVGVSHTLAYTSYEKYKSATVNYTGNSYNYTPKHHLNARLLFKPAPGWRSELEMDVESKYYLDSANTETYDRPNLYNLRTSYTAPAEQWSAWLHVLNLTDVKYGHRLSLSGTTRQYTSGYMPLTLRAGVAYNF